jgi:hypothetical protein
MAATKHIRERVAWFNDERGSTIIIVTAAAIVIFAFAALAIDGAILMMTRTQLHNAADAAALAGASALINGDKDEATARAILIASQNKAFQDGQAPVLIDEDDITFPEDDVVRVRTHRTVATEDPIRTFFLQVASELAGGTAEMSAVAAAKAFDVCSSRCLKPWAIPDRWNDTNGNGMWDAGEFYDADATGFIAPQDVGAEVVLKIGSPGETTVSGIFWAVDFPPLGEGEKPLTGSAWYRRWIAGCSPYVVDVGDRLQLEPGRMVGPTGQGMRELIAQDPGAYWDPTTKAVKGSAYALSPRIGLIPFFDPTLPPSQGRNYVTVTKLGAFFIESVNGNSEVRGRFIQITTQGNPCPGDGTGNSFVKNIVLVE